MWIGMLARPAAPGARPPPPPSPGPDGAPRGPRASQARRAVSGRSTAVSSSWPEASRSPLPREVWAREAGGAPPPVRGWFWGGEGGRAHPERRGEGVILALVGKGRLGGAEAAEGGGRRVV